MLDQSSLQLNFITPNTSPAIIGGSTDAISLRDYQRAVVKETYDLIRAGSKRILIVSGTGTGKTVIGAQIVQHAAIRRGKKVLFVVHRDCLIPQTHDKLSRFGIDCGFVKSGWEENRQALVQIASVQTLARRSWWTDSTFDVVFFDEAHVTAFSAVAQSMMTEYHPYSIYLGLTATPWRLSKKEGMGDVFDDLVAAPMPHEMMGRGYLVKPIYYGVAGADLEGVKTVGGDFAEDDLAIACDKPELVEQIVNEWLRLAVSRRTVVFAVNVQHSKNICEAFKRRNIPAVHIDGSTPTELRNQYFQQLASSECLVLCSCQALTEGFDCPPVSVILLCRPTKSKALYFQQIGRGLRISPETQKTDCIVLDQAGNVERFGFVEDLKRVTLTKGKEGGGGEAPTKQCGASGIDVSGRHGCGAYVYAFQMVCPHCDYRFEAKPKVTSLGELVKMLSQEEKKQFKFFRLKVRLAFKKGYSPGWASYLFRDAFGFSPHDEWRLGAVFGSNPDSDKKSEYLAYLENVASRKGRPDEWVRQQYEYEFGVQGGAE